MARGEIDHRQSRWFPRGIGISERRGRANSTAGAEVAAPSGGRLIEVDHLAPVEARVDIAEDERVICDRPPSVRCDCHKKGNTKD